MKLTLKQARVGAGLTQKQMAEKLGVSTVTYNSYERYPSKMQVKSLVKFSQATGIETSMLRLEG